MPGEDHEDGNFGGLTQAHPSARRRVAVARSRPLILAVVLVAFATLYPYLDAAGLCGEAGCPHFLPSQGSVDLPSAALTAVGVAATPDPARTFDLVPPSDRRPAQVYAAPDPEPPRP